MASVLSNKQNIGLVLHFLCTEKIIFSSSDGEKIRLEMVVFYVEDIQEIGWCYVYISLPFKKYIRAITLLVEKNETFVSGSFKLYNTRKNNSN